MERGLVMLSNKALGAAKDVAKITYVGGQTFSAVGQSSSNTTVTFSLTGGTNTTPADGDLVIVYTASTAQNSPPTTSIATSGYNTTTITSTDNFCTSLTVGYKTMGSTPDSTVLIGPTGSSASPITVAIQVWRNVDSVLPIDKAIATATGISSVLCNPPSITPATSGAIVVAGGSGATSNTTNGTFSSSNLTSFNTIGITSGGASGSGSIIGLGYYEWTSGAFDPAAFTYSVSDSPANCWAAVTLALRPKYSGTVPTFVASASTQNTSTGSSLVINKPTGTAQNDLMIAIMCSGDSASSTWTGDTGWTEIVDENNRPNIRIAYKVAGASEGSSYTFTASAGTNIASGSILTYRNAAYDTVGTFAEAVDPIVASGITVASDFCILIGAFAIGAASITCSTPTGMTARVTNNDATTPSYLIADQYVVSGVTNSRSSTAGSSARTAGILMSIKPA